MTDKPCQYKDGDRVVRFAFGQRGAVTSVRRRGRLLPDGSRFDVRVKWDGGGFGTCGDAALLPEKRP
jgi:hypothetical protein